MDARLGRSVAFVAGGYGRDRGQRPRAAKRGQAVECFVLLGAQSNPPAGSLESTVQQRQKPLLDVPIPCRIGIAQQLLPPRATRAQVAARSRSCRTKSISIYFSRFLSLRAAGEGVGASHLPGMVVARTRFRVWRRLSTLVRGGCDRSLRFAPPGLDRRGNRAPRALAQAGQRGDGGRRLGDGDPRHLGYLPVVQDWRRKGRAAD